MVISEIKIKGYKSFGNNEQTLKLNTENGELILLVGSNGNGKCVDKKTLIELDIDDLYLTDELITFLAETEKGNKIFLYIKEKKPLLYEKIKRYNKDK
jgi:predicted ATPase